MIPRQRGTLGGDDANLSAFALVCVLVRLVVAGRRIVAGRQGPVLQIFDAAHGSAAHLRAFGESMTSIAASVRREGRSAIKPQM